LLLAATKDMTSDIYYFTSIYWDTTKNSPDVIIPFKLLTRLGLKHNIIAYPEQLNEKFNNIYSRNVIVGHEVYGLIAQGLYDYYPKNLVCIKGDVAEITKCHYMHPELKKQEITPRRLSMFTKMGKNPFAMKHYKKWLSDATNSYNINLLDLFTWEQTMGSWVAMIQSECDIVQESFTPFNCRSLIETMLSVEEKHRRPPMRKLYKKLIASLWKKVLIEPINPHRGRKTDYIREAFIRAHLYNILPNDVKTLGKKIMGN
jgi:hypothetical protein